MLYIYIYLKVTIVTLCPRVEADPWRPTIYVVHGGHISTPVFL